MEINLAEAEYNLGQWQAAEARLQPLLAQESRLPLTTSGKHLQRAWILAHTHRAQEGLEICRVVGQRGLPRIYWAESSYTRAVCHLGLSQFEAAEGAVREGLDLTRRTSSTRNGLFLLARVAAAQERWEEAERHGRAGAEHPHRGQGGDGLLLWGEALQKLGRPQEAKQAWALATERDGQSAAAQQAQALLAVATPLEPPPR